MTLNAHSTDEKLQLSRLQRTQ